MLSDDSTKISSRIKKRSQKASYPQMIISALYRRKDTRTKLHWTIDKSIRMLTADVQSPSAVALHFQPANAALKITHDMR